MNVNEILEKIEKIESELQSLKSMIKTSANNAEFAPVKTANLPTKLPVEVFGEFDIEDGILHQYLGDSEEVTIPDVVTKIGHNAFKDNKTITKVNLPDTVTEIGENAFYQCKNLVEVNNVRNIIEIGKTAFYYCNSLEKLRFSNNLKSIGEGAFNSCSNLSISIPETCNYCECDNNRCFQYCRNVMIREVIK